MDTHLIGIGRWSMNTFSNYKMSLRNDIDDIFSFHPDGEFKAYSYGTISNDKLKENIADLSGVSIDKLRPVSYYNTVSKSTEIGFLAEDIQANLPCVVSTGDDSIKSIHYNYIIALLVKEIQDLKKQMGLIDETVSSVSDSDVQFDKIYPDKETDVIPTTKDVPIV